MTVQMITLRAHVYQNKRLAPGTRFEATGQSDARLLAALGRATLAPVDVPREASPAPAPAKAEERKPAAKPTAEAKAESDRLFFTRQFSEPPAAAAATTMPAPPQPGAAVDEEIKPKRAYRRKDMTAEGGDD